MSSGMSFICPVCGTPNLLSVEGSKGKETIQCAFCGFEYEVEGKSDREDEEDKDL